MRRVRIGSLGARVWMWVSDADDGTVAPIVATEVGGIPGDKGPTGDKGPDGDKGVPGDKGPNGDAGSAGANGTDGAPGTPGADGNPGAPGATGDKGPDGDKGPTGDAGANGTAATVWPVGSVFISVVSTNPATLLGVGTWSAIATGRFLIGVDSGQGALDTAEETGGAATHGHTFTQPDSHAAAAHSAHAGATVANHTDVVNHTHTENINTATTGGAVGFPALKDASTGGSEATGLVTSNPVSGGVAAQVHTVGQASAHSDHAAAAHAGGAVATGGVLPPYFAVYMWKRTA